ncbi:S9 family peptidase [Oleisolibacter albus]|uniref:S9 family peptidase n=1 Tax=Oleisolibacter albus TaxID=2171757 RepID=UPI000DF238CB|nr:S9 family peptidase [Oleisolibacter albus]
MNRTTGSAVAGAALSLMVGLASAAALAGSAAEFRQSAFPPPPVAKQVPTTLEKHGDVRVDPYDWMRDRDYPTVDDPAILEHLKAENAYVERVLGDAESPLRRTLFEEMKGRIKEDDSGVPYREGAYEYQVRYEAGKQYPVYVRRPAGKGDFATILDVNALAEGKGYMHVSSASPSPDGRYLAFTEDDDGSEQLKVRVKDLTTGKTIGGGISGASYGVAWASDSKTLFYTLQDEFQRAKKVMRHTVGADPKSDVLIYEEKDGPWTVSVGRSLSGRFIVIGAQNNASNEIRLLSADQPTAAPTVLVPRQTFRETQVADQGDTLWILTNDTHRNFRLVKAPAKDPSPANWTEVIAGSDDVYLTGIEAFRDWLILFDRKDGQQRVRVRDAQGQEHLIAFPDSSFDVGPGDNADYEAQTLRLSYESLVTPRTVYDYDLKARTLTTRKVQAIPSGYDASQYVTERLMAPSRDGKTRIPVSIVYRKGFEKDGKRPVLLYGYGSYGIPTFPRFSTNRISLLDRGFAFAIAQIRGGDEMGRGWYEDGKLEHKTNTFFDFIDAAQFLVAEGYAGKGTVSIQGGSAGGMLVGATLNLAPDGLFRAAIAQVPFVDVVSTMLDETLPLTAGEYDEWGNPNEKAAYLRMKGYSPYDNVSAKPYPHIMITAGLSDPRVTYWEPAKWAAKLRAMKTGDSVLLSYTNMGAGHGGAAGRYDALKETAMVYAFLLKAYGIEK